MADLLLHIGHVKTGSTWLQDAFARGARSLADDGIRYPQETRGEVDYDARVPAGNGLGLFDDPARAAARLRRRAGPRPGTTLFSSETLFARLDTLGDARLVPQAAEAAGFARVRVLLFVRAPLPLAASIWQQRLKGDRGETRDLDTFVAASFAIPARVVATVEALRGAGVEVTLRNYDAHRDDLLGATEAWLGLAHGRLARPQRTRLNRSLTRAEAALQLALNRHLGPSGRIFALRLGNRLPDLASDPPRVSAEVGRRFLDDNADALDRIDAMLPPGEALARTVPPDVAAPLVFAPEQLEVIAEGVAAHLNAPLGVRLRRLGRRLRRR